MRDFLLLLSSISSQWKRLVDLVQGAELFLVFCDSLYTQARCSSLMTGKQQIHVRDVSIIRNVPQLKRIRPWLRHRKCYFIVTLCFVFWYVRGEAYETVYFSIVISWIIQHWYTTSETFPLDRIIVLSLPFVLSLLLSLSRSFTAERIVSRNLISRTSQGSKSLWVILLKWQLWHLMHIICVYNMYTSFRAVIVSIVE